MHPAWWCLTFDWWLLYLLNLGFDHVGLATDNVSLTTDDLAQLQVLNCLAGELMTDPFESFVDIPDLVRQFFSGFLCMLFGPGIGFHAFDVLTDVRHARLDGLHVSVQRLKVSVKRIDFSVHSLDFGAHLLDALSDGGKYSIDIGMWHLNSGCSLLCDIHFVVLEPLSALWATVWSGWLTISMSLPRWRPVENLIVDNATSFITWFKFAHSIGFIIRFDRLIPLNSTLTMSSKQHHQSILGKRSSGASEEEKADVPQVSDILLWTALHPVFLQIFVSMANILLSFCIRNKYQKKKQHAKQNLKKKNYKNSCKNCNKSNSSRPSNSTRRLPNVIESTKNKKMRSNSGDRWSIKVPK